MEKRKDIFNITLSDKATTILNQLDFIDKFGRSTGKKNLSAFMNELIIDWFELNYTKSIPEVELQRAINELRKLQREVERAQDKLEVQAAIVRKKKDACKGVEE